MVGTDPKSAWMDNRHGTWRCALLGVFISALLLPAVAEGGVGAGAVPTFPPSVTVGDTAVPATIEVSNDNTPPQEQGTNTVCNAGDPAPCPAGQPGITLTPSCALLGMDAACVTGDPGVFRVASTGVGVAGTTCSGMSFAISQLDTTFGRLRLTPVGGQHVTLLGAGARCRVRFTFDVIKPPTIDQSAAPGIQTVQVVENLQWIGGLTAFVRGTSSGVTVQRAQPAIATSASGNVALGGQITDTAVVTGRVDPRAGDTVDFRLYGPDDAACSGPPVFQSLARPVDAAGRASSEPFTPTAAGVYRWRAFYSGDASNQPVAGACNDAGENVTVTPPPPTPPGPPTTVRSTTPPATPNAGRSPQVAVKGWKNRRCKGSNFTLRVNAQTEGLKRVRVTLDGKTIATSTKARFKVRVRAAATSSGRHVLRIVATGTHGQTARVLEFLRCGRPKQPRFVG